MTLHCVGECLPGMIASFEQTDVTWRDFLGQWRDAQAGLAGPVRVGKQGHDRYAKAAPHHLRDGLDRIQLHDFIAGKSELPKGVVDKDAGPCMAVKADERFFKQRFDGSVRTIGG